MLKEILPSILKIAVDAGKEILKIYYSEDFEVELKSDNSPLTKADKASHEIIVNGLNSLKKYASMQTYNHANTDKSLHDSMNEWSHDQIPILSEEGRDIPYTQRAGWSRYWLVDPLDGTKEFIKRNGEFTVNIALIENNEPVLGVIYAPEYQDERNKTKDKRNETKDKRNETKDKSERDEISIGIDVWVHECMSAAGDFEGTLYFAAKDLGAFKIYDNEFYKLKHDSQSSPPKAHNPKITAVGSRSHSSPVEKKILDDLGVTETISVGSSLKFCMIAENNAQVYYRHGPTMEWDVAAGYCIAKEAGAEIEGLKFNKEDPLNGSFLVKYLDQPA